MGQLKPSDPQIVYIKGGVGTSYGEVVDVIDSIREAGFRSDWSGRRQAQRIIPQSKIVNRPQEGVVPWQ
jgi:hypothetical protein